MARTLFDLHRTVTVVEINDGDGDPIKIGIKAPSHATQTRLLTILNEAKVQAELEAKTNGLRESYLANADNWPKDGLVDLILAIEMGRLPETPDPAAASDPAPNGDAPPVTPEQKQVTEDDVAVAQRQAQRREVLMGFEFDDLVNLYADLNVRLACMLQATGKFTVAQLCAVIVNPEPPYTPMFSDNVDAENYFGHLQPETVDALSEARNQFFADRAEKNRLEALDDKSKRPRFRGGIGQMSMRLRAVPLPPPAVKEA